MVSLQDNLGKPVREFWSLLMQKVVGVAVVTSGTWETFSSVNYLMRLYYFVKIIL